jgi:hypothetical protein
LFVIQRLEQRAGRPLKNVQRQHRFIDPQGAIACILVGAKTDPDKHTEPDQ